MSTENKKNNIDEEIKRAKAILMAVKILAKRNLYTGAVNQLYDYLFQYLKALLLTHGLEPKSHEEMEQLFNLHFVKTKIFDSKDEIFLERLSRYRTEADRNAVYDPTKNDFDDFLVDAKTLTEKIRKCLKEKNFLT